MTAILFYGYQLGSPDTPEEVEKRKKARESTRIHFIQDHGAVALPAKVIEAANPVEIMTGTFVVSPQEIAEFKQAVSDLGLAWKEPKWNLCSYD